MSDRNTPKRPGTRHSTGHSRAQTATEHRLRCLDEGQNGSNLVMGHEGTPEQDWIPIQTMCQ